MRTIMNARAHRRFGDMESVTQTGGGHRDLDPL